jgi:hypothetical protein
MKQAGGYKLNEFPPGKVNTSRGHRLSGPEWLSFRLAPACAGMARRAWGSLHKPDGLVDRSLPGGFLFMRTCIRCNKPFRLKKLHRALNQKRRGYRFCDLCMVRNFLDGMDEATPPHLIDRFTRNPTLTNEEFNRKLNL